MSAVEGQFYRPSKTTGHPHTNMAKAALNMMTRTSATDYFNDGIHMNSVDTGWVTDEEPRYNRTVMSSSPIPVHEGALRDFCLRHHILSLSFFGSVLREDFGPASDVDVLVEFEPTHVPGLLRLAAMEREMSELVGGRRVDMRTPRDLSRYFRNDVLAHAVVQYAQG